MDEKPTFQHPQPQSEQPIYGQVYSATPDNATLVQMVQDLQIELDALKVKRINFNTDIIGLYESVTVAPTLKPTSPYEQIKIATISGTTYLYAYDVGSLTWKRVTIA